MTKPKHPDGMTMGTFTSTEAGNEIEYFICQHCIEGNHASCTGLAWDREPGFKQLSSCECQSEKDGHKAKKSEGSMDGFLKFLEDNCPGDDAHSGGGEPQKPLLERCSMCREIYEAHRKQLGLWPQYVELLGKEIAEIAPIAHDRGWRSTRHEEGKKLRLQLGLGEYWDKEKALNWAICGWCAGTGKEEGTSAICPKCQGAGGKKLEKVGNPWAPNLDYPGKPVTKQTPESVLGREMTPMERILVEAVNEFCSCGGAGPENGCIVCKIWHRHVAASRKAGA